MKISKNVRTTITQDGAVLMNIEEGSMLTLNPTGSIIWQQIGEGRAPAQIAAHLAAEFRISQEQACADVNEFLEQLKAQRLIEVEESSGPRMLVSPKPGRLFCNLFGKRNSHVAQGHGSK